MQKKKRNVDRFKSYQILNKYLLKRHERLLLLKNMLRQTKVLSTKYAAGVIMFRENNIKGREYLLLHNKHASIEEWSPPKGRLKTDETDLEAAQRETFEETGLIVNKDYDFISENFNIKSIYQNGSKSKQVIYWLAKIKHQNTKIQLSKEHFEFQWFSLDEIIKQTFKHTHLYNTLIKANDFIHRKSIAPLII